jgi:hypothetical protein
MNKRSILVLTLGILTSLVLAACSSGASGDWAGEDERVGGESQAGPGSDSGPPQSENDGSTPERDYRIVTLLPRDAIPAIDNPQFLDAQEADEEYDPGEQVLGVFISGEARAYSTSLLSRHEIVNDEIDGVKFAVTW